MADSTRQLSVDEVLAVSRNGAVDGRPVTLLDVRRPDEYAAGHIKGARNLPVQELQSALELPPAEFQAKYGFPLPPAGDRAAVAVYCQRGSRAKAAVEHLRNAKYLDNLFAFIPGWVGFSAAAPEADIGRGTSAE